MSLNLNPRLFIFGRHASVPTVLNKWPSAASSTCARAGSPRSTTRSRTWPRRLLARRSASPACIFSLTICALAEELREISEGKRPPPPHDLSREDVERKKAAKAGGLTFIAAYVGAQLPASGIRLDAGVANSAVGISEQQRRKRRRAAHPDAAPVATTGLFRIAIPAADFRRPTNSAASDGRSIETHFEKWIRQPRLVARAERDREDGTRHNVCQPTPQRFLLDLDGTCRDD